MPSHPVAAALVKAVGGPVTGTSANISGQPGCARVADLDPQLGAGADVRIKDKDGRTALAVAKKYRRTEIIALLEKRGEER